MTESREPHSESRPTQRGFDILKRLQEFLAKKSVKDQEKKELEAAQEIAEWALLKFMSAEVQAPKKTFVANKYADSVALRDVVQKDATILRIKGSIVHRMEKLLWFVLVKTPQKTCAFMLETQGKTFEVLKPTVEAQKLAARETFDQDQMNQPIPIEFFLNTLLGHSHDTELAGSKQIDIMFAGSPEKTTRSAIQTTPVGAMELKPIEIPHS